MFAHQPPDVRVICWRTVTWNLVPTKAIFVKAYLNAARICKD